MQPPSYKPTYKYAARVFFLWAGMEILFLLPFIGVVPMLPLIAKQLLSLPYIAATSIYCMKVALGTVSPYSQS